MHQKRAELSDYFAEDHKEDIFDYIPPQRTNQIFTPRSVVTEMADLLEKENPGCFDNPDAVFADPYMKSGLYIAEIVKRLYRSEGLRNAFPDGQERIRHIIDKQVYGIAPTRIIFLISTAYVLGFDEDIRTHAAHFAQADTAHAAQEDGGWEKLMEDLFGKD